MKKMKKSIALKISVSLVLIALAAAMLTSLATGLATRTFFDRYVMDVRDIRYGQVLSLASGYYVYTGSWEGIQDFMFSETHISRYRGGYSTMGAKKDIAGEQIIIADGSGVVVGDSHQDLLGSTLKKDLLARGVPIMVMGEQVGTVLVMGTPIGFTGLTLEEEFLGSVRSYTIGAAVGTILVGALLGMYMGKRLTRPISSLVTASEHLSKRNLSYRVDIETDDEIGDLARSFNKMAENLEQNEKLRKNLLADVAHELRTPISIMRANLEAIQAGVIEADEEVILNLNDEILRMSRLVNDLQELSLAEAGELVLHKLPTDVGTWAKAIARSLQAEAAVKEIKLNTEIEENLPVLNLDQNRMDQVIQNLLNNAIRYTPEGGQIFFSVSKKDSKVWIQVRDRGPGIKEDDLPHIFNRFYRGEKSRTRSEGGMGLGLAIAKGFVEAHRGIISAESELDKGTTFFIVLPIEGEET